MMKGLVIFVSLFVSIELSITYDEPVCATSFAKMRHSESCSKWWECMWGVPVLKTCAASALVWSEKIEVCVDRYSNDDDCDIEEEPSSATIAERCANGERLIPHPTQCARFYNCSLIHDLNKPTNFPEQHLDECYYPYLFHPTYLACAWFTAVECDPRYEPTDAKEYLRYHCPVSHCRPPYVDFPSCKNKEDGVNEYQYRERSPYFVYCQDERFIPGTKQTCPAGLIFSGTTRTCVYPVLE